MSRPPISEAHTRPRRSPKPARGWLLALLVAGPIVGCASTQSSDGPSRGAAVLPSAPRSPEPPAVTAEPSSVTSLASLLPQQLDGTELHTFAVGQDIIARVAERMEVSPDQMEVAYASDHGAQFLQMYALRLADVDARQLADAWAAAAYPPATPDVTRANAEIGGRPATVVTAESVAGRLGTFYLYATDGVLVVAQAFDADTAALGLAALP